MDVFVQVCGLSRFDTDDVVWRMIAKEQPTFAPEPFTWGMCHQCERLIDSGMSLHSVNSFCILSSAVDL
jgi:hypothetical protein